MQPTSARCEIALHVVQGEQGFLAGPLDWARAVSNYFANKLSLNLLQDRLACPSELSLKRVIDTNLVVKFPRQIRAKPRFTSRHEHGLAVGRTPQDSFTCPSSDLRVFLVFIGENGEMTIKSPTRIGNCPLVSA